MKTRLPIFLLSAICFVAAGLAICSTPVLAQSDSAAIHGRVQNVVTGQYLNNARVAVRGTDSVAFTDQTGIYRLPRVPAGQVVLDVFYTGLDAQAIALEVPRSGYIEKDIAMTSAGRYGAEPDVVKLDSFVVATSRDTDGRSIAINEQRFAPNIKNVVAADALGDVMDGNVGEFMKYLPGITADYDNEDGSTVAYISVRGFTSNLTAVTADGGPMASTSNTFGDGREFSFNNVSINNVARIEVTKVPTPANPADAMAGSVNMISKSAFERKDAQFRYNVQFTGNSENLSLKKAAHTTEEKIYKVLPGANFDFTLPFNNRFGIVLTGLSADRFTKQQRSTTTFNSGGTSTGASLDRPFLRTYAMFNSPRVIERDSLGLKADWRITDNGVLSAGAQWSHYAVDRITTALAIDAGTNGTPTSSSGVPLSFGEDFTTGATGRGSLGMGGNASIASVQESKAGNVRYRFDNGRWRVETGVSHSTSSGGYRSPEVSGHFRQFAVAVRTPVRVSFRGMDRERPRQIEVFDNNNQPVDFNNPANYQLNTVNATPRETQDMFDTANLDLRRSLDFLPFPAAVQIGSAYRKQTRDIRRWNLNWTYNGIGGDLTPVPFMSPRQVNLDNDFGFSTFPHLSPVLAWRTFQQNPALFSKTAAQLRAEELFRITNSYEFEEAVSAVFLQAELKLLKGRLTMVTGVRYEGTDVNGIGPAIDLSAPFVRNPDGSFAHNAAGQRIRKPEAGAASSLEELKLTHHERAASNKKKYDGYYPSLHINYSITSNLLARAAYAKTYGRPNLLEIFPSTTIDEFDVDDPAAVQGTITLRNPGLRPWTANNYDLSLEYYTTKGGLISGGVFLKDIDGFFADDVRVATLEDTKVLGIEPSYVGWRVSTRYNSGKAKILGGEFNLQHSLAPLGSWGRNWSVFCSGTKLDLQGAQESSFANSRLSGGLTTEALNWGVTFSRRPFRLMAKWNFRGKQRITAEPSFGPDGANYFDRRLALDLNAELQLRREMFLFVNAQNAFNAPLVNMTYGSKTPDYAKRTFTNYNGVGLTVGIKGAF